MLGAREDYLQTMPLIGRPAVVTGCWLLIWIDMYLLVPEDKTMLLDHLIDREALKHGIAVSYADPVESLSGSH